MLKKEWKLELLLEIYKGVDIAQAIIYCNSKKTVESLASEMITRGHMVSAMHAELQQTDRDKVMKNSEQEQPEFSSLLTY